MPERFITRNRRVTILIDDPKRVVRWPAVTGANIDACESEVVGARLRRIFEASLEPRLPNEMNELLQKLE